MTEETLVWTARMVVGITFTISGVAKLRDLDGLVLGALRYRLLPARIVRPLAPLLPVAELLLAAALVTGIAVRLAAVGSALLIALFACAVSINLWRGRSIPCHCFGSSSHERIGAATLLRLAVLGGAALVGVASKADPAAWLPAPGPPNGWIHPLSLVASASVLLALLGPGEVLWRDVSAARLNARWRREAEKERRRVREQLERRRRERRLQRWKERADGRKKHGPTAVRIGRAPDHG